jgi:RNA-binding protein
MRRVGQVVRATGGLAVARSEDDSHPGIGTAVIDEDLDDVGTVVDVFGPADRPYLAISADRAAIAPLVGRVVYARSGQ